MLSTKLRRVRGRRPGRDGRASGGRTSEETVTEGLLSALMSGHLLPPAGELEEDEHDHDDEEEVRHGHGGGLADERLLEDEHERRRRARLITRSAPGHLPDDREGVEDVDHVDR